jgi:hypothetical protein
MCHLKQGGRKGGKMYKYSLKIHISFIKKKEEEEEEEAQLVIST